MTDKQHDFKAALNSLDNWWFIDGKIDPLKHTEQSLKELRRQKEIAAIHLRDNKETIQTALRLADRLYSGEVSEVIKAVAHIGIDFGYGVYELEQSVIDTARKLYEAEEQMIKEESE